MDKRIGLLPIPQTFTSLGITLTAHAYFKADKIAYQVQIGKELSDSNFLLYVLTEARKGGKYGTRKK